MSEQSSAASDTRRARRGRTIVIGDVHGCADELADLLELLGPTADDRVLMVGDLVMRGPESARTVALARSVGARAVRGNHEERLLRWRHQPKKQRGGGALAAVARALSEADWRYIEAMPLWISEPAHELVVVHAGLDPRLAVERQDERTLLLARTIDAEGRVSELRDGGAPWGAHYTGPPHVVFGHNALSDLQLHAWATGIDTGCVYGGALSALVLDAGSGVPPVADRRQAIVSIKARRTYQAIG